MPKPQEALYFLHFETNSALDYKSIDIFGNQGCQWLFRGKIPLPVSRKRTTCQWLKQDCYVVSPHQGTGRERKMSFAGRRSSWSFCLSPWRISKKRVPMHQMFQMQQVENDKCWTKRLFWRNKLQGIPIEKAAYWIQKGAHFRYRSTESTDEKVPTLR